MARTGTCSSSPVCWNCSPCDEPKSTSPSAGSRFAAASSVPTTVLSHTERADRVARPHAFASSTYVPVAAVTLIAPSSLLSKRTNEPTVTHPTAATLSKRVPSSKSRRTDAARCVPTCAANVFPELALTPLRLSETLVKRTASSATGSDSVPLCASKLALISALPAACGTTSHWPEPDCTLATSGVSDTTALCAVITMLDESLSRADTRS